MVSVEAKAACPWCADFTSTHFRPEMEQTGNLNERSLDKAASTAASDPETAKAWNTSVTSSQRATFLIVFREITLKL